MNRILALIVGVAIVGIVVFGVIVFTSAPPVPVQLPARQAEAAPASTPAASTPAAAPADTTPAAGADTATPGALPAADKAAEARPSTPEALARFDAWAKPLRDDGLTVKADHVSEAGDNVSVAGLSITGPDETPGWRWTAERAAVFDRGLFHLQAGGKVQLGITTAPGQETVWSGSADAIGFALQRDTRDVLDQAMVVRINGLSLAKDGDAAPLTLDDMQLRILLKGGTGLLPVGTDLTLRLTNVTLPAAAGTILGTAVKSFTTEFEMDKSLTAYSLQQALDFFTRGDAAVTLDTVATDWGTLHFVGRGTFGLDAAGAPHAEIAANLTDPVMLLDAIAAAGAAPAEALAADYASLLQEIGKYPNETALPMPITYKDGTFVLKAPAGDITLNLLGSATAATPAADASASDASDATPAAADASTATPATPAETAPAAPAAQ